MNNALYEDIGNKLDLGKLIDIQVIQSLWSGYGEISRLIFENKSVVVKHIKLPETYTHPYGWNSQFSHNRKVHSYAVEVNWYENFTKNYDDRCPMAKVNFSSQTKDEWLIVMDDLSSLGFDTIVKEANKTHIKTVLSWLASFHAKYMNI